MLIGRVGSEEGRRGLAPRTQERVKVAHVATVDLSLRFLLLNQLESLHEAGYSVTGISSAGTTSRRSRNEAFVTSPSR